jgi:hypothetical protein
MSAWRASAISSIEHFVDQSLGTNVFHVQLERRVPNEWNVHLGILLVMELALDAVVHERHEASCNDNTVANVSWEHVVCHRCTHSDMSVLAFKMLSSVMRM